MTFTIITLLLILILAWAGVCTVIAFRVLNSRERRNIRKRLRGG